MLGDSTSGFVRGIARVALLGDRTSGFVRG